MTTPKIPNSFTITFPEDYIPTLIQTIGIEETKKKILNEGMVAFGKEINRMFDSLEPNISPTIQ